MGLLSLVELASAVLISAAELVALVATELVCAGLVGAELLGAELARLASRGLLIVDRAWACFGHWDFTLRWLAELAALRAKVWCRVNSAVAESVWRLGGNPGDNVL